MLRSPIALIHTLVAPHMRFVEEEALESLKVPGSTAGGSAAVLGAARAFADLQPEGVEVCCLIYISMLLKLTLVMLCNIIAFSLSTFHLNCTPLHLLEPAINCTVVYIWIVNLTSIAEECCNSSG